MKETLQNPVWWFSAVIVGIALNVGSAYLKTLIDRWIERRSQKNSERRSLHEIALEAAADKIRGNPYGIMIHFERALHERIRGLGFILVGLMMILTATGNGWLVALIMPAIGGLVLGTGIRYNRIANEMSEVATRACQENRADQNEGHLENRDVADLEHENSKDYAEAHVESK